MFFSSLVFLSAFLIESIGSYISIVGLSALFSTNPVIIAMALSLDIAKVVTVSFLYKQWENISKSMRYYMTVAAAILMVITSSGAAGYLSAEFQKAIIPTKGTEIQVQSMTEEKGRLSARKLEIDKQISQLPPENVRGRQKLQKQFAGELEHINTRIVEIDQELPKLQMEQVDVNAHAGPILYIAQAFNTTVESAVKYVILLIIFVFDPLAVALIIAGNFLLDQRRKEQKEEAIEARRVAEQLAAIKQEVDHIEEMVEQPKTEVFECVLPIPDREKKGTLVTTLPAFPILDEDAALAAFEPVNTHEPAFDAAAFEESAAAVEEESSKEKSTEVLNHLKETLVDQELPPLPDEKLDQLEKLNEQIASILAEESPKKRRGRPRKDEAEPKPTVQTEEQLEAILQEPLDLPSDEEVAQLIPDELKQEAVAESTISEEVVAEEAPIEVEPIVEEEPEEIAVSESLNAVNSNAADVTFHHEVEQVSDNWKATKKVMNHYAS